MKKVICALTVLVIFFGFGAAISFAGVTVPPVLGDFVWNDINRNGLQDDGEPGVADVVVELYRCDGSFVDATTTDADGLYLFNKEDYETEYIVEFILPDGFVFTMQDQGGDDAIDSDAGLDGRTGCTPIFYSYNDVKWDAGIHLPVECSLEVAMEACVLAAPAPENNCQGKVTRMILEYTGEGCDASSHSQDSKKAKCSGDPAGTGNVDIYITNKKRNRIWGSATHLSVGGSVLADAANAGKSNFDADTLVSVYDENGGLLQELKFHTSCSQPLGVGDQFGSMKLVSMTTTEGGEFPQPPTNTCETELPGTPGFFDVEYTYSITNTSTDPVTDVSVTDDFGQVPGSPIASIAPGDTVVLAAIVSLDEETTNTVVALASEDCTAEATTTITKAPPEPEVCTTKIQKVLLKYIGPDILNATVEFGPIAKGGLPIVYNNIDLISGVTVLSSPAENGWTIDSTEHGKADLGARLKTYIDGVKEEIHTSCSTPFLSGQPAPLNDPKGDPSPTWFVVNFQQK